MNNQRWYCVSNSDHWQPRRTGCSEERQPQARRRLTTASASEATESWRGEGRQDDNDAGDDSGRGGGPGPADSARSRRPAPRRQGECQRQANGLQEGDLHLHSEPPPPLSPLAPPRPPPSPQTVLTGGGPTASRHRRKAQLHGVLGGAAAGYRVCTTR